MIIAMVQEPIKIDVTDSQSLMLHSQIMVSRNTRYRIIEKDVDIAKQKMIVAEMAYKFARLELEMIQLQSEQLLNQEKSLIGSFFTQTRISNTLMRTLQERYGDGVKFIFDSDHKDVWVIALFSSDAPPLLHDEKDFSGEHYELPADDELDDEDGGDEMPGMV